MSEEKPYPKEYQNRERVTGKDMFDHLRSKFVPPLVPILRPPSSYGFLEVTHEQYHKAVDEFERLCMLSNVTGEPIGELQRIGIQMLLGWDYDYYAKFRP